MRSRLPPDQVTWRKEKVATEVHSNVTMLLDTATLADDPNLLDSKSQSSKQMLIRSTYSNRLYLCSGVLASLISMACLSPNKHLSVPQN